MNSIRAECCRIFRQDSSHFCISSTNWKWILDKACYIDWKGGNQKEQCLMNKLAAVRP